MPRRDPLWGVGRLDASEGAAASPAGVHPSNANKPSTVQWGLARAASRPVDPVEDMGRQVAGCSGAPLAAQVSRLETMSSCLSAAPTATSSRTLFAINSSNGIRKYRSLMTVK